MNRIRIFLRKLAEENKRKIIEGLKSLQKVGGKKKVFSARQYKRTLVTRKLCHMVGASTIRNLKMMLKQNIVHNFPVAVEDIEIAEKIFGTDVVRNQPILCCILSNV